MEDITDIKVGECINSQYVKTARVHYVQCSKSKTWDVVTAHDSVSIILFNTTRQVLIVVKQFRPAVYFTEAKYNKEMECFNTSDYPVSIGVCLEFCAGIIDKDQSIAETARDEVLEECGYDVPLSLLQKVTSFKTSVGHSGSTQTMFYAEVTDDMKVSQGGGSEAEGEVIEVVELSLSEAKSLIFNDSSPRALSLLFGLMWFFHEKNPDLSPSQCK